MSSPLRSIIHFTIPAFPMAVERVKSPRLRGRPVALVLGTGTQSRCYSVSPEARAGGVHSGMLCRKAREVCRDLVLLNPDPPLYQRASQAIKRILDDFSPLIEPVRSGRFFLDYIGCRRLFGKPEQAVERARNLILSQLRLPSLSGLAVNKLVSRVASGDSEPRGFLEVEPGVEAPFLGPHPVRVLPAVDEKTFTILSELYIQTVEEVRSLSWEQLTTVFGRRGAILARQAQGIDPTPVKPASAPPQVQMIEELDEACNDKEALFLRLRQMIVAGSQELRRKHAVAQEIRLHILYTDGRSECNCHRFRAPQESDAIWLRAGQELIQRTLTRRTRVRRMELTFSQLQFHARQLALSLCDAKTFAQPSSAVPTSIAVSSASVRLDRSLLALESVSKRYGAGALKWGWG